MSKNKHDAPQFADPRLNHLAQELTDHPLPAPAMPDSARQRLRQRLLAPAAPPFWHHFGAALGTAVALILLVGAVALIWLAQSPQDTAVGPISAARETSTPETAVPNAQTAAEEVHGEHTAVFGNLIQLNSFSQTPGPYIVGETLELTLIWELRQPAQQPYAAALHIFDAQGNLRQQIDQWLEWEDAQPTTQWPVGAARSVRHILPTDQLAPGEYRVTAVVYTDYPQKTERLLTAEGTEAAELFTFTLEDALDNDAPGSISEQPPSSYPHATSNLLQIEQVDPPAGTLLTGPQPITITFSMQLNGVPTATIRAKVVEMMGSSFRGVAGNDVVVTPEDGRFILIIPFTTQELNGPANLGLYVEGRTDPNPRTPANLFIDMPGEVLWRYEPENRGQDAGTP